MCSCSIAPQTAIKSLPEVKLPKPKMFSMMLRKMEELWGFIDKSLARGFLQPVKSRMTAPVLFKKKDRSLRLSVDYVG